MGCWCCCCCYRCCCSSRCSIGKATRNPLCFDYIPDFALGRLKATWLQVVMDDMASLCYWVQLQMAFCTEPHAMFWLCVWESRDSSLPETIHFVTFKAQG